MEGEDLTQADPSQPEPSSGPVDPGKSSEPADGGDLTPERMKSWEASNNNKAQELAQERKRLEAERAEWDQQKAAMYSPGGQPQGGYGQGVPGQGQGYNPNFQQQPYGGQAPQQANPNNQKHFQELVNRFGYEDAVAMRGAYNEDAQAYKAQLDQVTQLATQTQVNVYMAQIDAKGVRSFGEEWDKRGEKAKQLILDNALLGKTLAIKDAMNMVRAQTGYYDELPQKAIDQAHQQVDQKGQSNVSGQGLATQPSGAPPVESPDDAFSAAWRQHGGE